MTSNGVEKIVKFIFSSRNDIEIILEQISDLKKIDVGSYPLYDDGIAISIFLVTPEKNILKYTYSNLVFYDSQDNQGYELPLSNELILKNMIIEELIDMRIK